MPKMQNRYGVSDVVDSWGEKENLMAYDNLNDFFRTGLTSMTSVSISYGNETCNLFLLCQYYRKGVLSTRIN